MPVSKIKPVIKCHRCGEHFTVSHLLTYYDPESKVMREVVQNLGKLLCPTCQRRKQYYIDIGRWEDWERGVL